MDNNECKNEKKQHFNSLPRELLIYIFEYLPESDLLQMRLVCKFWRNVTYLPQFMKKFRLYVTESNVGRICKTILNDIAAIERLAYPSLVLYNLSPNHIITLKTLGQKVRTLYLFNSKVFSSLNNCFPELEDLQFRRFLYGENRSLNGLDLRKFKQFKSLHLSMLFSVNFDGNVLLRDLISDPPFKMQNLTLCISSLPDERLIIQTLQCHGSSLKELAIIIYSIPSYFSEWNKVFPLLNKLEILIIYGKIDYCWLSDLVERLPKAAPLKKCSLNGDTGRITSRYNILLKRIIEKWCDSLERLNLINWTQITDESAAHIRLCRRLKVLNVLYGSEMADDNLLQWRFPAETKTTLNVLLFNGNGSELTTLSLKNCEQSVNDYTLQNIFRYQQKLQILKLSSCRQITDNGLIGFGANPAPISKLKGLQSLDLGGCKNITDRALIEAFKFIHLRELILGDTGGISSIGIKELVKNCPALEDLSIANCSMIGDDAILCITRDLKRLRYLSISNCKLFTGKSIDYIVQYCKSFKRLTFYGVDPWVGISIRNQWQRLEELNITIQRVDPFCDGKGYRPEFIYW